MAQCTDSDVAALKESGRLLRFAAEHVKNFDPDLPLAIAEAQDAAANGTWDPKIAQRFWGAFARLCDLVAPVSLDCLAASEPDIQPARWLAFAGGVRKSIAQRSSARYLWVLIALLAMIVPLQLYVWICTNLSTQIDELLAAEKTRYAAVVSEYSKKVATKNSQEPDVPFAQAADTIHVGLDRIATKTHFLESALMLNFPSNATTKAPKCVDPAAQPRGSEEGDSYDPFAFCETPGPEALPFKAFNFVSARMTAIQVEILKIQDRANVIAGVIGSYLLPILFGTIGAVAYVVRTISDQIRTTTFAPNSPTRHIMRVALGAMAGVVVGLFGDLSNKLSLSPLAIAFLAGYGVEALFSMFDGLIDKLKSVNSKS